MTRVFGVSFLFSLLLCSCGGDIPPGQEEVGSEPVVGLSLMTLETTPLPQGEALSGTVTSRDRSRLLARIAGQVESIRVKPGDRVEAGELLLTIGDNSASQGLKAAEAALTMAESARKSALANHAMLNKELARYRKLFDKEAVTPQELERIEAQAEIAHQQFKAADADLNRARARREQALMSLSYNKVTAPYAASVISREVEEGASVMPGAPLLTLDREAGWEIETALPETMAGSVAIGRELKVWVPAVKGEYAGIVTEISAAADPRSRSFPMRIALKEGGTLRAGLFARIYFQQRSIAALLIPESAILQRGQLSGVYVVDDHRVRFRLIRTGRRWDERVEILSGLDPGEVIIVDDQDRVRPGSRVEGG